MTLEQLRIFVEVAALQHITRAAEQLHMTQSAVSAAISALEARHGVTLFDRVGRSIVLNPTGRLFLEEAHKVLAAARAAEAALMDLSGLMHGELSIMASQTVGAYWLPAHLVRYRQLYPGIHLTIGIANTAEVARAVRDGTAEIGLIEWADDQPGVLSRPLAQDDMVVVVAPGHPWARRQQPVTDLADSDWVLREPGSGTRHAFDNLIRDQGLDPTRLRVSLELPENEAVTGVVEQGLGATLISRAVVAAALADGRLVQVPFPPVPRPYFLLRHRERWYSKAAEAFEALVLPPPART